MPASSLYATTYTGMPPQLRTIGSVPHTSTAAVHRDPTMALEEQTGKLGRPQTRQPALVTELSECHLISAPALMATFDGPVAPPYVVPPMVR